MKFEEVKIYSTKNICKGGNILTNDQIFMLVSRIKELSSEIKLLRKVFEKQNEFIEKNLKIEEEILKKLNK